MCYTVQGPHVESLINHPVCEPALSISAEWPLFPHWCSLHVNKRAMYCSTVGQWNNLNNYYQKKFNCNNNKMTTKFQLRALCCIWVSLPCNDPIRPQKLDYVANACSAKTREHTCRTVKLKDSEESQTHRKVKLWQIDVKSCLIKGKVTIRV